MTAVSTPARAALPAPQPAGDDEGYLQFAAVATLVTRVFYREAAKVAGVDEGARRRLARLRVKEAALRTRLTAPLGSDPPTLADFAVVLPATATKTLASAAAFGIDLHELRGAVLLSGAAYAEDSSTRLLLARVASHDAQAISVLRALTGRPGDTGLLVPVDLEQASDRLDALLQIKEIIG